MRLIDADALIDTLGVSDEEIDFKEMLREAPTIDIPHADDWERYSERLWKKAYERGKADRPQEWIPCSERLPSEKGMYLVTSREKATAEEFGFDLDDVEVKKMRFDEDGWRIPKHIPEWINGVVHTTVLAWMPLPKPYGEREGE